MGKVCLASYIKKMKNKNSFTTLKIFGYDFETTFLFPILVN